MIKQSGIPFIGKLIKAIFIVTFLSLFVYANDNEINKKINTNLYDFVALKNSQKALEDIKNLSNAIKAKELKKVNEDFKTFVKSWKSVQAFYILGDINEDFIDTPRYMDIFHNGNEDITKQLDRAIKSKDEIRVSLFKNSLKSINALEYILYKKNIKEKRVNDIALAITKRLTSHLEDIFSAYLDNKKMFLADKKKSNAVIINAIIQSSYKLKEWRVGDVIGLTKKYENKADNARAEYYLSKSSAIAIEAILQTYKNVLDNDSYEDFGDYLISLTDGKDIKKLRTSLHKSLKLIKEIKNDDFSNAKELYEEINEIHVILFVEMVEDLAINAKILDSDGD
ncbi:MAG: hypothetical protein C0625_04390 [Arcobacter sp.]|nr:MAG: hypothetical protein C0625_04390 [Arcobacter sp.]